MGALEAKVKATCSKIDTYLGSKPSAKSDDDISSSIEPYLRTIPSHQPSQVDQLDYSNDEDSTCDEDLTDMTISIGDCLCNPWKHRRTKQ